MRMPGSQILALQHWMCSPVLSADKQVSKTETKPPLPGRAYPSSAEAVLVILGHPHPLQGSGWGTAPCPVLPSIVFCFPLGACRTRLIPCLRGTTSDVCSHDHLPRSLFFFGKTVPVPSIVPHVTTWCLSPCGILVIFLWTCCHFGLYLH